MSNTNIANMTDKQLRNEVQLLRDELAIFKRKYEDLLYNLDDDNFSSTFLKEKNGMKTAIEITAEGLSTKVSNEEFQTEIKQVSEEIKLSASALGQEISSLSVTTSGIRSRVGSLENGEYGRFTLFEQTADGFKLTGDVKITQIAQVGGDLYIGDYSTDNEEKHIYFNNQANICTFQTGVGQNGMEINSNGFRIACRPDAIKFVAPDGGSLTYDSITLADYVSQYGSGGYAVFG